MAESNPYSSQSIAGFNDGPPPDDGSRNAGNALTWQRHLDELANPLNSFAAAINTEILGAFGAMAMTTDPGEETVVIAMQEFGLR